MAAWWNDLNIFEQFFYAVGFTSLLLMFVIAALVILGIDPTSRKISSAQGHGIHILSWHTLIAFSLGYGWGGIICLRIGLHEIVALILSCLLGLAFMFLMYLLMLSAYGLYSRDPKNLHIAVGAIGEVYSTIPGNRSGYGKVRVQVGADTMILRGETNSASAFKPGEQVRIVDRISGSRFLVREK